MRDGTNVKQNDGEETKSEILDTIFLYLLWKP